MSKEEASKIIKDGLEDMSLDFADEEQYEALNMAIEALQEPKTGHWIPTYGNVKCSVCGSVKESRRVGKATHYCDFCGAKMVEQERSNKECQKKKP